MSKLSQKPSRPDDFASKRTGYDIREQNRGHSKIKGDRVAEWNKEGQKTGEGGDSRTVCSE